MDRLAVMKSYVVVCRTQSFSGAARSLGVSGSLMSRHVAWLEEDLGVRLINRTARSVTLTEQGKSYLEFCERILREIDEQEDAVRHSHQQVAGSLSILSPKWIGSLDVSDAVAEFAVAHPQIQVNFDIGMVSDRLYEFLENGYDAAFHTHQLRDSSVKVRRVATLPFVLCAAPGYLQRHGMPGTLSELAQHDCVVHRQDPTWLLVEPDGKEVHYKSNRPAFTSNTFLVLQKAALQGMGIAMLPMRPVQSHLRTGRLIRVLESYSVPTRPLYVVYPPGLQSMQRLRVFVDYISDWFKQYPLDDLPSLEPAATGIAATAIAAAHAL
jgi:DNA-binding transcriptional LysR family regulator